MYLKIRIQPSEKGKEAAVTAAAAQPRRLLSSITEEALGTRSSVYLPAANIPILYRRYGADIR